LRGEKTETIVLWVKVSKSTIDKVWRRYRETGSGFATPYTGMRSKITPKLEGKIRAEIDVNHDITLVELVEKSTLPIGISRLSQMLISWGYSFKTSHSIRRRKNEKTYKKNGRRGEKTVGLGPFQAQIFG
jgi:transposase